MRHSLWCGLVVMLLAVPSRRAENPSSPSIHVATIYINGHIETMNSLGGSAQAVAIEDGKFVAEARLVTHVADYRAQHSEVAQSAVAVASKA